MSTPRLSVLLPVYNGEKYLAGTIDSIISQSFGDFELFILDDGSADRTPDIIAQYVRSDPRVRSVSHENRGVGATLDRGISEARGALLAEIGADDVALEGRLAKQIDFLDHNPGYVLVGSNLQIIDANGEVVGRRRYPTTDKQLKAALPVYNPFASPAVMYRRDDALAAGGYTSRFSTCEDYDFLLRLACRGQVANIPEALTAYRLHEQSTKSQQTHRQLRDTMQIKRVAFSEYGYPRTAASQAALLAQQVFALLPAPVIYKAFQRWAVEPATDPAARPSN